MTDCWGDRLMRKSQYPFSPRSASTLNSLPEKKLTRSGWLRLSSRSRGAMINSDRTFSELMARATGALKSRICVSRLLGCTSGTCAK